MKPTNKLTLPLLRAKASLRAGFSLIELLVVIAVIGIIAAIAIPNIAGLTDSAGDAKDQRNAQQIVSVYSAAIAAGYTPQTTEALAVGLVTGAAPAAVNTMTFHVPNVSGDDIAAARDYINYANATVVYVPAGGAGL